MPSHFHDGVSYDDVYYQVPDGLTLYARDYLGPSDDAPVVLCMHGLTRNSRDFEPLAPVLAQTHRVIVPEQRGRGNSEYDSDIQRYQPQTYVGDMMFLLDSLGITRCATVGTSMGGLMAMGMNALKPTLFSHVVLNDIGPVVAEAGLNRIKQYVGSASEFDNWEQAIDYTRRVNGAAFPNATEQDWRWFAQRICSERDGKVVLDYDVNLSKPMKVDDAAAVPLDLWPLFDAMVGTPVLLVRGGISDLLDTETVAEMQLHHPALEYLEVPEVGHAPILNEAGVSEAISEFINR
jgi:pimeloyl-ACP methyl ester carboxylesterase